MDRLAGRVCDNSMLTTNIKMRVYQTCTLSTLLYGNEAWTLYSRQECTLNTFLMSCLRKILNIIQEDHVPNKDVLAQAEIPSMHTQLSQRCLHWFGHVRCMKDGRIPKDMLYRELATGSKPAGRSVLHYKDVCKRDLKAGDINPANWETVAADRNGWRLAVRAGV
ncbi:hypothetical protein Pmani_020917 [Petrolisthes manimaculis]|uniref:Uncharacterized protein n=1 Tax=Petrolisthes manimaculis TaxID=1843537 RepID=A0AAE1PFU3_9EUCA|nr:hypothetical protein Pmani_020917 [Petrolisthes manimaculis]